MTITFRDRTDASKQLAGRLLNLQAIGPLPGPGSLGVPVDYVRCGMGNACHGESWSSAYHSSRQGSEQMSHVRWSGLVAMLGAALCLVLTPIQAWVFSGGDSPPVVLAARPLLDVADRIHAALGPRISLDAYYFYGRMFCLVYLAAIIGLVGLHTFHRQGRRQEQLWFRILLGGLGIALAGDVVAYWGGRGDISESPVQGLGFTVEMLAVLVVLIDSVFYGRTILREGAVPPWAAWPFLIAGPGAIPVVFLTGYIPHGAVLPFSLAMATAGSFLFRRARPADSPPG